MNRQTRWSPEPRAALLVLLLSTVPSWPAAAARPDAFQEHYNQGLARYGDGDYAAAVREFKAAYELRPRPRLLFNIGQSYRLLRDYPEALRYYQLYTNMERDPKPGLQAEVERYISELIKLVCRAGDLAPELAKLCQGHSAPAAPLLQQLPGQKDGIEKPVGWLDPPPPPERPTAQVPLYRKWWFWTAIGGAAMVATGIGLGVGLNQRSCGNTWCPTF